MAKTGDWDQGGLLQGQGFENLGEQTLLYYGSLGSTSVGKFATARRKSASLPCRADRLADLIVDSTTEGSGDYQMKENGEQLHDPIAED